MKPAPESTVNPAARILAVLAMLLGLAACGTTPLPVASDPPDAEVDCHAPPDASRAQYIIGYGSLMQDESRKRTSPKAGPAHPVEVVGYRRGWFSRPTTVGFGTTFLGAVRERLGRFNAVIYEVGPGELLETDKREASYCRASVARSALRPLEAGFDTAPDAQAWIYVSKPGSVATPDARYPIVQSYVDIFLSGCLEQAQRHALADFPRQCLATTTDWSEHWVNDRIQPRRPFAFQPKARQIDELLATGLPRYFARIRIEGG